MSIFTMGIFLGSDLALAIGAGLVANLPTEGMLLCTIFDNIYQWQKLFLLIGLRGFVIALLLLTVKEPARKDLLQENGHAAKLPLKESLAIIFQYPNAFLIVILYK